MSIIVCRMAAKSEVSRASPMAGDLRSLLADYSVEKVYEQLLIEGSVLRAAVRDGDFPARLRALTERAAFL